MARRFDSAREWNRRHNHYLTNPETIENAAAMIETMQKRGEWDLRDLKGWDMFFEDEMTLANMERQPYQRYSWLHIAIYKYAAAVAMCPFGIYRGEEKVEKHPADDLFKYVNPWLSKFELFQALTIFQKLKGEAFIVFPETIGQAIGRGGKIPSMMLVPNPDHMKHVVGDEGVKAWVYKHPRKDAVPLDLDNVIHFKEFNPYNQYRGMSKIDCLKLGMRIDFKAAQYNDAFFENSAVPEGLVVVPPEIDADQFDKIKDQWIKRHEGKKRSHRIGFAYGGIDFKALGMSQKDMEFLESRRYAREEVLALLEVPKGLLSITDDLNYATLIGLKKSFWEEGVIPFQTKIEDKLQTDFFDKRAPDVRGRFDRSNIPALKEDMKEKVDQAEKLFKMSWPINAINERLELGMDEVPWGNVGYLPVMTQPVGSEEEGEGEKKEADEIIVADFPDSNFPNKEIREKIWSNWDTRAKPLEQRFEAKTKNFFREQKAKIMNALYKGMRGKRSEADVMVFDWDEEKERLVKVALPMVERIMEDGFEFALTLIGEGSFDVSHPEAVAWLDKKVPKIKDIVETVKKRIMKQVITGIEDGETIDQIADRIKGEYKMTANRARTIARTETGGAFNAGEEMTFRNNGIEKKEWLTAKFEVRESHDSMDGQIVKINDKFRTGAGNYLLYPGDPEGPAADIINCRCALLPVVEE
ncbi:MAG: phage portal protein [Thermodesulfobacteriota bacterium]